ncbi:MAG: extracellular solute-binding protein [Spirochaetales bacterium]|nr:extracellular solute-binding protein [Spirochaetales bacterium]
MRLKTIAVTAFLISCAFLLGSCPEPGNTITFWVMPNAENPGHASWLEKKKAEFLEREGIIVNYEIVSWADSWTRIRDALAAGAVPDVIQLRSSWTAHFAASGGLAKIDPGEFGGAESFAPNLLAQASYRGTHYGVPWFGETAALVCDRSALEAVKSEAPRTFSDLLAVGKKIAARRGGGKALALPGLGSGGLVGSFSLFLYGEGGRYVSPDGKKAAFADEPGVRAVMDYIAFYREGLAAPASLESGAGGEERLFSGGGAAMCFLTPAGLRRARKGRPGDNVSVRAAPAGPAGDGVPLTGSNLVIPEKSANKRKASRWISCLLEDANLSAYARDVCAVLPAKKRILESDAFREGDWPVFTAGLSRAVPYPPLASWTAMESEISNALRLALLTAVTGGYKAEIVRDILKKAAAAADTRLSGEGEAGTP